MLRYLVQFFFRRFFDAGGSVTETRLTPKGAFALLFVPGCVMSILLMQKYSSVGRLTRKQFVWDLYAQAVTDKYVFIVYCMVISALVALLRWDSLFPDRRDHANLAPLPVEMRTIFLAKVLALCQFVLSFVVVVNAGSTLLFPPIALEGSGNVPDLLRFMTAHAATMLLAGIWSFSVVLAITGLLVALLPYSLLRVAKRCTQFAGVLALILLVLSTPTYLKLIGNPEAIQWLPPMWFLGLYELLAGRATPLWSSFSAIAVISTAGALMLAALAYGLSYRLFFLRAAESLPVASALLRIPEFAFKPLDMTVLRSPYEGGCFRFIMKTLARSDRHSAAFVAMIGLGLTVAVLNLMGRWPVGGLVATFVAIYSLLTALRVSFGIPSEQDCSWIFRITAGPNIDPRAIVQRSMACLVAPLVIMPSFVFGPLHLVYATLATALLIELLTADFRVLPFTCSWLPGPKNPAVAAMGWFAGLITVGQTLGGLEGFFLDRPAGMTVILAMLAGLLALLRRARGASDSVEWKDSRGDLELLRIAE